MFRSLYPPSTAECLAQAWALGTRGTISAALEATLALRAEAQRNRDCETEACSALQAAWFSFQTSAIEYGLEHATAAKRIYEGLGSKPGEAAAGAIEAWLLTEAGLVEEAVREAEQALALIEKTDDPDILGLATNVLGLVLWYAGQFGMAIPLCVEAANLADQARDSVAASWWRINVAGAHAGYGMQALQNGKADEAEAALHEAIRVNATALALANETGDLWCQALALCNGAQYLCALGRVEEAIIQLDHCESLPWTPSRRSRLHYVTTRAEALLLLRRPHEALALCEETLDQAATSADIETRILLLKHLSTAHEHLGAFEEALNCFKHFHVAHQALNRERAQSQARIAGLRYETHRLREQAEAAQAQVASLVVTSHSDPLTGLANRRAFDRALADLAAAPRPFALAILDLDHFKRINDCFSHPVGDAVLCQVGAILARGCQPGDLVARFGGEEFVLLLFTGTEPEAAVTLCEALRQSIAAFAWEQHHPRLKVTTSIGIAWNGEGSSPPEVLALADQRLYRAKRLGRNRLVAASGTVDDMQQTGTQVVSATRLRHRAGRPPPAH